MNEIPTKLTLEIKDNIDAHFRGRGFEQDCYSLLADKIIARICLAIERGEPHLPNEAGRINTLEWADAEDWLRRMWDHGANDFIALRPEEKK